LTLEELIEWEASKLILAVKVISLPPTIFLILQTHLFREINDGSFKDLKWMNRKTFVLSPHILHSLLPEMKIQKKKMLMDQKMRMIGEKIVKRRKRIGRMKCGQMRCEMKAL